MGMRWYGATLPPVMADDEPMMRAVLTDRAQADGYVVAPDADLTSDVVQSMDGEIRACIARIAVLD